MNRTGILRRLVVTAFVAAVVAVIVGGASLARAGGTTGEDGFTLIETTTGQKFLDVDHSGSPTPGDQAIFHSVLKDHAGTTVGTVDVVSTIVLGGKAVFHAVATLPGGTLSATGLIRLASSTTIRGTIDGGTGRFDQARGQITSTSTGATTATDVFDIDE